LRYFRVFQTLRSQFSRASWINASLGSATNATSVNAFLLRNGDSSRLALPSSLSFELRNCE
jgi:hypothetical protein